MTVNNNPEDNCTQASAAAPLASLGDETVQPQGAAARHARWLLERSEFGTPEALAVRAEVPWERAASLVAAAFDDDDHDDFDLAGSVDHAAELFDSGEDAVRADRCTVTPTMPSDGSRDSFPVFCETALMHVQFWARSNEEIANFVAEPVRPVNAVRDLELWWEVLGNLAVVIEDVAGVPAAQVVAESRFVDDLGMDSINAIEVGVHIEEVYNVRVPDAVLPGLLTVGDAVDYITAKCRRPAAAADSPPSTTAPSAMPSSSAESGMFGSQRRKQAL